MAAARKLRIASETTKAPRKASKSLRTFFKSKHAWPHVGVMMCVLMSACLNGYANAQHAPIPVLGVVLGIMVPCLIFVLCKIAGMQVGRRKHYLALYTAFVGACILFLSVWHCACSLQTLTGSPWWLALMLAIAIDGGLVACELDIVLG